MLDSEGVAIETRLGETPVVSSQLSRMQRGIVLLLCACAEMAVTQNKKHAPLWFQSGTGSSHLLGVEPRRRLARLASQRMRVTASCKFLGGTESLAPQLAAQTVSGLAPQPSRETGPLNNVCFLQAFGTIA